MACDRENRQARLERESAWPVSQSLRSDAPRIESANFYPDGGGYYLREALAAHLQVAPECIILGNGSNEIIEFIGHAFLAPSSEMVTSENAFVAYRLAASLFGARTIAVPDQDYRFDLDGILDAINDRTRVISIANPNNPTGTMVTQAAIEDFMARIRRRGDRFR